MELVVDLSTGGVMLREHEDLKRLSVVVPLHRGDGPDKGALGALAAALSVHSVGTVGPDGDVLVTTAALRRLAVDAAREDGTTLAPGWERDFSGMVEHAATKGWLSDDDSLRAHVAWEG